jgi:2-dehydro-3-deoxyphosphogluconate aldolase/(4S)-4-hydroxy-2-oxoglutarate aldolase
MDEHRTLEKIRELALVAVVRGNSREAALEVSEALVEGGVKGIEIAFTTPEAHLVLEELNEQYGNEVLLGAGTVTTPQHVEQSVAADAAFLVCPGCDPDLIPVMKDTGLAVIPGVLTPSELMTARGLGLEHLKLFPGSLGGPQYLKALLGPFPDTNLMPTGGVSLENVNEWFAAGAFAVGVGGALSPSSIDDSREREELVRQAALFVAAVSEKSLSEQKCG